MKKLILLMSLLLLSTSVFGQSVYPTTLDSEATIVNFAENRTTYLTTGITETDTVAEVQLNPFMDLQYAVVQIGNELCLASSNVGPSTINLVERGIMGTSAVTHKKMALVRVVWSGHSWNAGAQAIRSLEYKLGIGDFPAGLASINSILGISSAGVSKWDTPANFGITLSGLTGTVPVNKGGTGQTTANAALNALLPSQTGNSGKFLKTDATNSSWAALTSTDIPNLDAAKITTGTLPIARGGTNATSFSATNGLAYFNGTSLVNSSHALFDGTDFSLVNPTAATTGPVHRSSPYFYLTGQGWDTASGGSSKIKHIRMQMVPETNVSQGTEPVSSLKMDAYQVAGVGGWHNFFSYGASPTDTLFTRIKLGNPIYGAYGGILDVYYDGGFYFKRMNGTDTAPLIAERIGAGSVYGNIFFNNYNPIIVSHFGQPITFQSGIPAGYTSAGAGYDASTYADFKMPIRAVHTTTPQLRVGYDGSNYYTATVASNGAITLDAVGSGAKFTYSDAVNVPDDAFASGWDGKTEAPTKNAVYDIVKGNNFGNRHTYTASDDLGLYTVNFINAAGSTAFEIVASPSTYNGVLVVRNIGAGTATITAASGNVNGGSSLVLTAGQSAILVPDGTNWWNIN